MSKDTDIVKRTVDRYRATFAKLTMDFFPELTHNYFFSPEISIIAIKEFSGKPTVCHVNRVTERDKAVSTVFSNYPKK